MILASRLLLRASELPPPAPPSYHFCLPSSSLSSSSSSSHHTLTVGDVLSLKRSFSVADVVDYSRVTGDSNPVHLDADSARAAGFQGSIVHGMLVASLFPAIIASHFPGAIYVSQSLQFKSPAYIAEELLAEVRPLSLKANQNRYVAKFLTRCFKNGEQLVIHGEALAVLPTLAYKK